MEVVESKCICAESCHSPNATRRYPEWKEGENNLETFRNNGYMIVRGLYTAGEVEEAKKEIASLIKQWFEKLYRDEKEGNDWEEVVNR